MGDLTCTPWRRYGHDRVYVGRGDARLGHLDRTNGAVVVADEATRGEVVAALAAGGWLTPPPEPAVAPPEPAVTAAPAAPPAPDWAITLPGDTATNRPGAGARALAQEARAAAPVRTTLARLLRVHTDERAWRVGADGEEMVARRLSRLGPEWTVVHDLPIGGNGANVDHVLAGPGGVFSLNTKNLTGKVWVGGATFLVNGHRTDYVPKARAEARRVAKVLTAAAGVPVEVHGAVVVICDEFVVKEQPRDVSVVRRRDVEQWLRRRPAVLDVAAVARLARAIRDPRTWQA